MQFGICDPCLANILMRCYTTTMKKREHDLTPSSAGSNDANSPALAALLDALLAMKTPSELQALLEDLCTPAELEAIADRWRVVPLLLDNLAYREIHDRTGVSVTTIGRIARCLGLGAGGYRIAAERVLAGRSGARPEKPPSSGSSQS